MSDKKLNFIDTGHLQSAIFRWDNEGGAGFSGSQLGSIQYLALT